MAGQNTHRVLLVRACLAVLVVMGFVGCATQQSSHIIEPDQASMPEPTVYVIEAEDHATLGTFSLVAADSVGLAAFGWDIASLDLDGRDPALVEAQ